MKIAVIDPGLTGAAVVLEQICGAAMLISVIDLPIMGDGAKRRLDAVTFARWLNNQAPTHVYIEAGRAMPRQGVTSMFRYGRVCGAVEGVVAACRIPVTMVEPTTWKRHLRLNSNKEDCRARAIQLLPDAASELQRVKDHHRGEAVLLGFYGLEKGIAGGGGAS
jgi:crossover junction endodeoxyribonuclease RuvC